MPDITKAEELHAACIETGITAIVTAVTFTSYVCKDESRYKYLPADMIERATAVYNPTLDELMATDLLVASLPSSVLEAVSYHQRDLMNRYGDAINNHFIHNVLQAHFNPAVVQFYSPLASKKNADRFIECVYGDADKSFLNNEQKKDMIVCVLENIDDLAQVALNDKKVATDFSNAVRDHREAVIAMAETCDALARHLKNND